MNETPRLRSAFPTTPRTDLRSRSANSRSASFPPRSGSQSLSSPVTKAVENVKPSQVPQDGPLIPLNVIDAPTQRFYAAAFYIGLLAWRLYNAYNVTDELDSTWLFLKWLGIDAALFVALPAFRIPWLEWSFATTLTIWLLHAITNTFLMYRIPIPALSWLGAMVKVAYDREIAISEHRVKVADILQNSSIILGKQIIQILPEGSAILNPEKLSFCLDSATTTAQLPIQINQTQPISIELIRYDIDGDGQETILIGQKQARKLRLDADKGLARSDTKSPRILHYQASKTGLYRLSRVIDETKLEVRRRSYDVAVVECPKASISLETKDKCTGQLSGIAIHVAGVPPFKVKYKKKTGQHQSSSISQSVQPPDPAQDEEQKSREVVNADRPHMSWIKSEAASVEINESLDQTGVWSYQLEEIEDGLGNKVSLISEKAKRAGSNNHSQRLTVHPRPVLSLRECDPQKPLRVAEGEWVDMKLQIKSQNQLPKNDWPLKLKYTFTPESATEVAPIEELFYDISSHDAAPRISRAGKYNLEAVQSQFCRGEINEPSSCSLYNPPRPDLTMESEVVSDKCAGNPIGIIVNMDFTGTPPFTVSYTQSGKSAPLSKTFDHMRGKLDLGGREGAGSYTYQIIEIKDSVYGKVSLKDRGLILKQVIKHSAFAHFTDQNRRPVEICLGQSVPLHVAFEGEGPWQLDYEIVYGSKRKKHNLQSHEGNLELNINELNEGGRYSIVLTGIRDKSGCLKALNDERNIEVRAERASAAFGDINGQRTIKVLDDKSHHIPMKLRGIPPWTVGVQNIDKGSEPRYTSFPNANDVLEVSEAGTYELLSVHDSCPGVVDPKANKFTINLVERPTLNIKESSSIKIIGRNVYQKAAVCQGDEDSLSLGLAGSPPYHLKYNQVSHLVKGHRGPIVKPLFIASSNTVIKMETAKAGDYTYEFTELSDDQYKLNHRFSRFSVKQKIYALPTAEFADAGKTYGYCEEDPNTPDGKMETIPLQLKGEAPFSIEIAVTHQGTTNRPEIKRINDIASNSFSWSIPRSSFGLGTHHLQIRSVTDSRGCVSAMDTEASFVRIHVSSPPAIIPLETNTDYCVGDRISFSLSGQAPFRVSYTFQGRARRADVSSHEFKRITDAPGEFIITDISDSAMGGGGKCRASKDIRKIIHPYPSVRLDKGQTKISDIHEGGEVDIQFQFTGTPPFEFTFIRSENLPMKSKLKNKKPAVLETRHETSQDYTKTIRATEEGTYEVVAIKDRYCAYSMAGGIGSNTKSAKPGSKDQKLLKG